jgi:hypothetical protein
MTCVVIACTTDCARILSYFPRSLPETCYRAQGKGQVTPCVQLGSACSQPSEPGRECMVVPGCLQLVTWAAGRAAAWSAGTPQG